MLDVKGKTEIRRAEVADAPAISRLIYSTSVACCFTPEQPCPDWYEESVQPARIQELIGSGNMVWLVALQENSPVGVLAVSDRSHVKYFFVQPSCQKMGIGRQLWDYAARGGWLADTLTVRSSLCAVPVYARLGFRAVEPPKIANGVYYQTMTSARVLNDD